MSVNVAESYGNRLVIAIVLYGLSISLPGCRAASPLIGWTHVRLEATVENEGIQKTSHLDIDGVDTVGQVEAVIVNQEAKVEFDSRGKRYWTDLVVQLGPEQASGNAVWEMEELYRITKSGDYVVRLGGVADAGPFLSEEAVTGTLNVSIEVRTRGRHDATGLVQEVLHPQVNSIDGVRWLWLSPSEQLPPLIVPLSSEERYTVRVRVDLDAKRQGVVHREPVSVRGAFRLHVEPRSKWEERLARKHTLSEALVTLWEREGYGTPDSYQSLKKAADALSRLFYDEAIDYVDVHAPRDRWEACYEHARILREWYEARMRLDPSLAKWFRMTTVRRSTFLIWQSSNLITPSVAKDPGRWLEDGSGIVLEPKPRVEGSFYGRHLTAAEFRMWGSHPKLQKTAQPPPVAGRRQEELKAH